MRSGSVLKRFIGAAMCGALVMAGISGCRIQYVEDETASEETTAGSMEEDRQVDINLWYSDWLLYTSDAADEEGSVGIGGGRGFLKKKRRG